MTERTIPAPDEAEIDFFARLIYASHLLGLDTMKGEPAYNDLEPDARQRFRDLAVAQIESVKLNV